MSERLEHIFGPVYDKNSKVLILGTFPSVKSRANNFYYGHPQNRFWKLMALLTEESVPITISEKKKLLLKHGIAVWDVIQSCEITGSSDSSIRNVMPVDLSELLYSSDVGKIYANGDKAFRLYNRYCLSHTGMEIVRMPSTSPANAAFTLELLKNYWSVVKSELI